jgi:hypothetical protein
VKVTLDTLDDTESDEPEVPDLICEDQGNQPQVLEPAYTYQHASRRLPEELDYFESDDYANTNSILEYFDPSLLTPEEYDTVDTFSSMSSCDQSSWTSSRESHSGETTEEDNSIASLLSEGLSETQSLTINEDNLPKSFLQLRGISVANYNMGCNFNISTSIRLMIQFNLQILAIQEHTPWNKELTDAEISSIQRSCDRYKFFAIITKLQLVIMDKQLVTSI